MGGIDTATICVASASSSAWDGPQATRIRPVSKQTKTKYVFGFHESHLLWSNPPTVRATRIAKAKMAPSLRRKALWTIQRSIANVTAADTYL
jgi:hypothetical protein